MTDEMALAEALRAAIGAFVRKTRAGAGTVSDARSETLGYLGREGAGLTVADLARRRGVTHQSMRQVLGDLAAEGLVTGRPDPQDGRATLYTLCPAGRDLLQAGRAARAEWLAAHWVSRLTAPERATMAEAIRLMDRLKD